MCVRISSTHCHCPVEHIAAEDAFLAGQFVSYHVYPYYPDYLNYILNCVDMDNKPVWDGKLPATLLIS